MVPSIASACQWKIRRLRSQLDTGGAVFQVRLHHTRTIGQPFRAMTCDERKIDFGPDSDFD
jgi:hypothetical protein